MPTLAIRHRDYIGVALAYQHALHPGTRLHLHGAWPDRSAARRETW
ncbi:hypothetical protein [Streptomyces chrestomyceticus]|nr:hypothetical protein [Streptomyces chrestomyceticus]